MEDGPEVKVKLRAIRRQHRRRMIRRAHRIMLPHFEDKDKLIEWCAHHGEHLRVCSCFMCKKPRYGHQDRLSNTKVINAELNEDIE